MLVKHIKKSTAQLIWGVCVRVRMCVSLIFLCLICINTPCTEFLKRQLCAPSWYQFFSTAFKLSSAQPTGARKSKACKSSEYLRCDEWVRMCVCIAIGADCVTYGLCLELRVLQLKRIHWLIANCLCCNFCFFFFALPATNRFWYENSLPFFTLLYKTFFHTNMPP